MKYIDLWKIKHTNGGASDVFPIWIIALGCLCVWLWGNCMTPGYPISLRRINSPSRIQKGQMPNEKGLPFPMNKCLRSERTNWQGVAVVATY